MVSVFLDVRILLVGLVCFSRLDGFVCVLTLAFYMVWFVSMSFRIFLDGLHMFGIFVQ